MENRGERRHFEDLNNPLEEKRGGTVVEPFGGNVILGWGIAKYLRDRRFYALLIDYPSPP